MLALGGKQVQSMVTGVGMDWRKRKTHLFNRNHFVETCRRCVYDATQCTQGGRQKYGTENGCSSRKIREENARFHQYVLTMDQAKMLQLMLKVPVIIFFLEVDLLTVSTGLPSSKSIETPSEINGELVVGRLFVQPILLGNPVPLFWGKCHVWGFEMEGYA